MSAKKVVFTLVSLSCPRKGLFFIGFIRLSARSVVFFIGFRRVVREKREKHLCKNNIVRGQPARHGFATAEELNWPHNSPSFTIESPLARPHSFASPRPLARTNETKRFPGWRFHKRTHPPQPPIHLYPANYTLIS